MPNLPTKDSQPSLLVFRKPLMGGQQHPNPEFILYVDMNVYREWQRDPTKIPLMDICKVPEILFNRTGSKTGMIERPSNEILEDTFGTKNFTEIVKFMVENGQWQPFGRHEDLRSKDQPLFPKTSRFIKH